MGDSDKVVKGVIEASEGVGVVFADRGGDLTIATLPSQKDELDRILQDLANETGALLEIGAGAGAEAEAEAMNADEDARAAQPPQTT
jgi:GTP cyclohydrolase III